MLNRSQLITLFGLNRRNKTWLNRWPNDMRQFIVKTSSATFNPQSDIARLLRHIAYGNLVAAKAMLEADPRLVLQAGDTETPSGLKVLHTTPLECALGAGDPEMAKMIEPYFEAKEIDGGATVREEQYAHYRQHIEDMLNPEKNPPYDFTLLIETLMAAQPEDVTAALNCDMSRDCILRDVLEQFRKDFTPGSIKSGMHFNYHHLLRAYEVYEQNWGGLYNSGGNNYNKLDLFSRQIIGFIQRSLPAIDRMAYAQSLYDVTENKAEIKRSFNFTYGGGSFPDTAGGHVSLSGLGFEFFSGGGGRGRLAGGSGWVMARVRACWKSYVEQKHQTCRTYAATSRREVVSLCNLLR
jgi:hypothetical protein